MTTAKIAIITAAATAGVFLMVGGIVRAKACSWRNPEKRHAYFSKRVAKKLDLDTEQKAKLDSIIKEVHEKKTEWKGFKEEVRMAAKTELLSDSVDQARLNKLFDDKQEKFTAMRKFIIAKTAEFHAVLTPKQRQKIASRMDKFHRRHGRCRG